MSRRLNTTVLMVFALSGCATMSPEECLQANWEEVGYNDAVFVEIDALTAAFYRSL